MARRIESGASAHYFILQLLFPLVLSCYYCYHSYRSCFELWPVGGMADENSVPEADDDVGFLEAAGIGPWSPADEAEELSDGAANTAAEHDTWSDAVAESLAPDFPDAVGPSFSVARRRGRGRGRGYGSRLLLQQHQQQDQQPPRQQGQASQIQLARQVRENNVLARRKEQQRQIQIEHGPARPALQAATAYGDKGQLCHVGTALQRAMASVLVRCVESSKAKREKDPESFKLLDTLIDGNALTCSASSIANLVPGSGSRASVQEKLLDAGAASHQLCGTLTSSFLSHVQQVMVAAGATPVMFFLKVKYDESPTKVRVCTVHTPASSMRPGQLILPQTCRTAAQLDHFLRSLGLSKASHSETARHAKVLQTQLAVAVLYSQKQGTEERFCWMRGSVPCALQAMNKSTAENERRCLKESIHNIAEIDRLSSGFPVRIRHVCCDRYSANYKAESGLRQDFPQWTVLHLTCDVHKLSSSISWTQTSCEREISGLLNSALVTGELGAVRKLRSLLTDLLCRQLDVVEEPPPTDDLTVQYRKDVFALFLPLEGVPDATRRVNMKRQFILRQFLNGEIQKQSPIKHHCGMFCCRSRDETLLNCSLYLSWALIPGSCPTLNRKNWLGSLPNLDWIGLLQAHHGLYCKLLLLYMGSPTTAVRPQQPQEPVTDTANTDANHRDSWDDAIEDALRTIAESETVAAAPAADAGDGDAGHADDHGDPAAGAPGETAWAEENRRRRVSVRQWLLGDP